MMELHLFSKSGEFAPRTRLEVFEIRSNFCQLTALNPHTDTTHIEVLSTCCYADSREHALCPILSFRCWTSMTTMQARKQFFLDNYPKGHKAMIAVMKVKAATMVKAGNLNKEPPSSKVAVTSSQTNFANGTCEMELSNTPLLWLNFNAS